MTSLDLLAYAFDVAQGMIGFLGCECSVPAHDQLFIQEVLLLRPTLNPFIPQSIDTGGCPNTGIGLWDV